MGTEQGTLITAKAVSEYLGITTQALANMRANGRGPKFYRVGSAIRYDRADIMAWLESNQHVSTDEYAPESA